MPRRHKPLPSTHPYRWMVSYADFMTLLFAFFVVMYSISAVNNQKFERMSHALVGVFESPASFDLPIKLTDILPPIIYTPEDDDTNDEDRLDLQEMQNNLQVLVQENLDDLLRQPEFSLQVQNDWLKIEVQSDVLFNSGTNQLTPEGEQILVQFANTINQFKHSINIDVFNDIPLEGDGNSWVLSATQGASIVHFLTMDKVEASRLAVVAYGPYQPVATNDDEEGRSINRRVVFMIDRTTKQRDYLKTVTNHHLSAKP